MSARDKEILAWLENAITAREERARALGGGVITVKSYDSGETSLEGAIHLSDATALHEDEIAWIVLNDPESALQRCAADRALVEVFTPILKNGNKMERTLASYTLRQIALGYGWATTLPGLKEAVDLAYRSGTRAEYTAACEAYEEARAEAKRPEGER